MLLNGRWRKLLLTLHVLTAVGFPGAVVAFLALAIVGASNANPDVERAAYIAMGPLTGDVIVPLAAASLLIGLVQSIGTPWGLFRHYWVIIKLALTLIAVAVLMLQTATINMLATAALHGDLGAMSEPRAAMILHASGGLVVLIVVTVLSVYKPRGMTRYGTKQLGAASP